MIIETRHLLTTQDSERIAVWEVYDDIKDTGDFTKPHTKDILLIHGAFSDKRVCLGMARYLAKLGHHCYIMEWRGRGDSTIPKEDYNFETVALFDVTATLNHLINELALSNLHCITHSGGGICLTICLSQNPQFKPHINSMSFFACQAYGAALSRRRYTKILISKSMTKALGYVPAKKTKMGSINESYSTMKQWYKWNLNRNFKSTLNKATLNKLNKNRGSATGAQANKTNPLIKTNFDYRDIMPHISIPIYSISATGDTFVAPSSGCELFLSDFRNPKNTFHNFSISNGALEDYSHTRIFMSHNAAKEIWPTVLAWIEKHS